MGNFKYLVYEIEMAKHNFPVLGFKTYGIFDTFEEAEYFIKINSMKKSAMITTVQSYLSDAAEDTGVIEEVK